jgi:hypothetical protein
VGYYVLIKEVEKLKVQYVILLAIVVGIAAFVIPSYAAMPDAENVKVVHEGTTVGCTVCHVEGNFKEVNNYGKAYKEAGRSVDAVKAVDAADSDEDGVANGAEIAAGTNPGDAASK